MPKKAAKKAGGVRIRGLERLAQAGEGARQAAAPPRAAGRVEDEALPDELQPLLAKLERAHRVLHNHLDQQGLEELRAALHGPAAWQLVASHPWGTDVLVACLNTDSPDLLMRRLEVGGDTAQPAPRMNLLNEGADFNALHHAVYYRATRCVSALLERGDNPDARVPSSGKTSLHMLGTSGSVDTRQDHEMLPGERRADGSNAAWHAAKCAEIAALLHDAGACITATNARGMDPVIAAIDRGNLEVAAILIATWADQQIDCASYLKEIVVCDPSACDCPWHTQGFRELFAALHRAWRPALPPPGADAGQLPPPGSHQPRWVAVLLELALRCKASRTLEWLCKHADAEAVRVRTMPGCLPLVHVALQENWPQAVKLLAKAGVDLTAADAEGLSALHIACRDGRAQFVAQLCLAPERGAREALLRQRSPDGLTALGLLAAEGSSSQLRFLLSVCKNIDLDIRPLLEQQLPTTAVMPPVFAVAVHGRHEALQLLLAAGSGLDLESHACTTHINVKSGEFLRERADGSEGVTLLMAAASAGEVPIVKQLLAAGADSGQAPADNTRFTDTVEAVLCNLRLGQPLGPEKPAAELGAHAEPLLQRWLQKLQPGSGEPADAADSSAEMPGAVGEWAMAWLGHRASARFGCLLLLEHGARLTKAQVGALLVLLAAADADCKGAEALQRFLHTKLKQSGDGDGFQATRGWLPRWLQPW